MTFEKKRALLLRVQRASLKGAGWIIRLAYRLLFRGRYAEFKADRYFSLTCSMPGIRRNIWSPTPESDARVKAESEALKKIMRAQALEKPLKKEIIIQRPPEPDRGFRPEDIWQPPEL